MKSVRELNEMFMTAYGYEDKNLLCFFSPGRVNLIGEHIDYNGGMVFPAAISIGVYGMMSLKTNNIVRLRSLNANGEITIPLSTCIVNDPLDDWGNYPKGVIKYLLQKGFKLKGCDILFFSDLPNASGLSSSAALEVLTGYMMMQGSGNNEIDRVKLALLCQKVENHFMKVNCGIMDQFSVAMGKKDNAILLNCETLAYNYIPFRLQDYSLVIINSNKSRGLADSKYNERRVECERALEVINKEKHYENLCQVEPQDIENLVLDEMIKKRARHVVSENVRVKKAVHALKNGNLKEFGGLMTQSHRSLQYDYEVTGLELDTIVEEALKVDGCIGARMTGAGFGGCAIALVQNSSISEFKTKVSSNYTKITGLVPDFYTTVIEDGVKRLTQNS